jgi:hypothetical protein
VWRVSDVVILSENIAYKTHLGTTSHRSRPNVLQIPTCKLAAPGSSLPSADLVAQRLLSTHLLHQLSNADSQASEADHQRCNGRHSLSALMSDLVDMSDIGRSCCVHSFGGVGLGALVLCLKLSADWIGGGPDGRYLPLWWRNVCSGYA